jgi:hypothetical protein
MKQMRISCWLVLVSAVAIGLVLAWTAVKRPKPSGKDWLLVSTPTVGSRTKPGGTTPAVTFCVSNVGPRPVEFQVRWFECRAKGGRILLTTIQAPLAPVVLAPKKSTHLTIDVRLLAAPIEGCLCCCQVWWLECESPWRRSARLIDGPMSSLFNIFHLAWPPWPPQQRTNGSIFAANVEVADYFRRMYGFTRAQWLEDLARQHAALTNSTPGGDLVAMAVRWLNDDERIESEARSAFHDFCRRTTDLTRDAEPSAPPNAAPLPR